MKKKTIFIIILAYFVLYCKSQTVGYNYDLNGNRIQRVLGVSSTNRVAHNDSTQSYSEPTMKLAMDYGVSVFPNPASTSINIISNKIPEDAKATLILYDNNGRALKQIDNVKNQEEFSLQGFDAGIYVIVLTVSDKDKLYYKVIKQ